MKRKHTVELLIKEKIEKELITKSPNLAREIKKINTSNNKMEVIFHNGSSFVVSPCNDDARGQRLTLLVVDEFRQCDKTVLKCLTPCTVTCIIKLSEFGSEIGNYIMSKEG